MRPQAVHVHPRWTGDVLDGPDIALVQMKRALIHSVPTVASLSFDLEPNDVIHAFRWVRQLQYAKLTVVKSDVWPMASSAGQHIFTSVGDATTCEGG